MTTVDIRSLPIGAVVVDEEGRVIDANEAVRQLLVHDPIGAALTDLVEPRAVEELDALLDGSSDLIMVEARLRVDGPTLFVEVSTTPAAVEGAAVVYIQPVPHRDALTGLADRLALVHHIDLLLRGMRRRHRSALLVLVDLDGFAAVNDAHGHTVGDAVLVETARQLRSAVRPDDTVARLGNDEFVVLCPDVPPDHAPPLIERIQRAAGAKLEVPGGRLTVRGSIGAILFSEHTDTVTDLLRRAHDELQAAKPSN